MSGSPIKFKVSSSGEEGDDKKKAEQKQAKSSPELKQASKIRPVRRSSARQRARRAEWTPKLPEVENVEKPAQIAAPKPVEPSETTPQPAAPKQAEVNAATPDQKPKPKPPENMDHSVADYDDYLKKLDEQEQLFDLSDDTFMDALREWSDEKKKIWGPRLKIASKSSWKATRKGSSSVISRLSSTSTRLYKKLGLVKIGAAVGLIVLSIGVISFVANRGESGLEGEVAAATDDSGTVQPVGAPFPIVASDSIVESRGVSFDRETGVASFRDKFNELEVTVSQQPLTQEQIDRGEQFLNEVAFSLQTSTSFPTEKGTVHLTIPSEDNPDESQVGVFIYKDLLIFVRTHDIQFEPVDWVEFVNSLG